MVPLPHGVILLGEVAQRLPVLTVACRRCPRHGRLRTDRLLAKHGAAFPMPSLRRIVAGDCPSWNVTSLYDLCGVMFPDLVDAFGGEPSPTGPAPASRNPG